MSNKALILSAIRGCPGIGVAGLAGRLGMQKPNARRDTLQLAGEGLVTLEEGEDGYRFYPAGGAAPDQINPLDHHRLQSNPSSQIIEGRFRELPKPTSQSRALVLAGQPYDSRTEEALRQHAAARARAWENGTGGHLPSPFFAALNSVYTADPNGDESLFALAQAVNEHTVAIQAADARAAQEQESRRLAEQARGTAARKKEDEERRKAEQHWAIEALLGWSGAAAEDWSPVGHSASSAKGDPEPEPRGVVHLDEVRGK